MRVILDENPMKKYCSLADQHERSYKKRKKGLPDLPFPVEVAEAEFLDWLNRVKQQLPHCYDHGNKRNKVLCTCLCQPNSELLATFMVQFASQPKATRQTVLKGIIMAASALDDSKRTVAEEGHDTEAFKQPYRIPVADNRSGALCVFGFRNIFILREDAWKTIRQSIKTGQPGPIPHKNLGNKHRADNSMIMAARPSLQRFFKELGEKHGEPYATRFIRETTGIGVRDTQVDVVELPSSFRKRDLYGKFCHQQGYVTKATAKGDYGKVKDYKKRQDDEWPEDLEPGPVCDWRCFREFWKEAFPYIRIRPKSEDTCGECYIFKNRLKYKEHDDEDSSDDEEDGDNGEFREEKLIQAAAAHVEQAQCMREAVQARTAKAAEDLQNSVPHSQRSYAIVADYAQNLDLPHFGEEQPGETYYFSPKNVFIFGVVDLALSPAELFAYTYQEETGRKGGNNVASLLMMHLQRQSMLQESETGEPLPGKLLTIAADNCSGQNKNNMVLRLANYLVEKGYYKEVEVLFYVRGHTKNACDREFNLMKLNFHKKNIYTFNSSLEEENLLSVLGRQKGITVIEVTEDMFKDWDKLENRLYQRLKDGTILINHVFQVSKERGATIVLTREDTAVDKQLQNVGKRLNQAERIRILQEEQPETLVAPGLAKIKQVDLFKKWRKFVPTIFQDAICPRPPDDMLEEIAEQRRNKSRERRQNKAG
jgi:hypothetical protein